MQPLKMRRPTLAGAGPVAEDDDAVGRFFDTATVGLVQESLEAALDYEKTLARRQYRLRQFIMNCRVYIDNADGLADALEDRRAA